MDGILAERYFFKNVNTFVIKINMIFIYNMFIKQQFIKVVGTPSWLAPP